MSHKTSKTTRKKGMPMKAPDEEEEEMKPPAPLPQLTASLAHQFGIQELGRLLQEDRVLMALDARTSSHLHGPISIPQIDEAYTTLEAVRMLLTLLEESGLEVRTRDLSALASFDVDAVTNTIRRLFHTLGEIVGIAMKREPSPRRAPSSRRRKATAGSSTGSSRYRSVSSVVDESDSGSNAPERMTISPEAPPFRPAEAASAAALPSTQSTLPLPAMPSSNVPGMQPDMFRRALDALVRGISGLSPPTAPVPAMTVPAPTMVAPQRSATPAPTMTAPEIPTTQGPGSDVSMRSAYPTSTQAAYPADDPDDFFDLGTQTGATSRSAAVASNGSGGSMTRIRISATSDLKSFSGRDATEEKSCTWLNKLQSAAKRDGMSPAEMCLLINDLITGPARQWYLQLSRDIRSSWNDLSSQFQYQYCGKGVSVARKYYHATKRSDETPLEYLHRLTVAGIRAKLRVKDGNAAERREHVEHFIDTLGSHEQALADQLIMLSIEEAEALERILRARQRSRDRQGKVVYNPSKFRAKTPAPSPAKAVSSLRAQDEQDHDDYAMVSQVEDERREEPTRVSAMTPANRGETSMLTLRTDAAQE
ncbi:hypothetical protein PF008_g29667 [Phytophthora fragariae]|uniref:Retrotransposon gag domain-containing protein n=1 Tax=Phytophthora fragariae TaxID=53985 RepID=A0A6G0Q7R0_9STRA|nr:hypothetical protein PF008_g29667 [Phytophthora fragariae]